MVELKEVSQGLFTTQFKALPELMPKILEASLADNAFISKMEEYASNQTENGGRSSKAMPRVSVETVPEMRDSNASAALKEICAFKNEVVSALKEKDTFLKSKEYDQAIAFHTYKRNADGEYGFLPHIDFGMMAIVFSMGKDFEFSEDNGVHWRKLSDVDGVNSETVIINLGRLYSTFTGLNPVLHRVTASGSLGDGKLSEIAKFTIGFFIELNADTEIPTEIPDHVRGNNRKNWEFLIAHCETVNDYTEGRRKRTIIEKDGLLQLA